MPEEAPVKDITRTKVIWAIVIIVVIAGVIGGGLFWYFYSKGSQTQKQVTDKGKQWVGVLSTNKGLIKISHEGVLEKDSNGKVKIIIPPWSKPGGLGAFKLLQDGRIVYIVRSKIPATSKKNTVYVWSIGSSSPGKAFFTIDNGKKIGSFTRQ